MEIEREGKRLHVEKDGGAEKNTCSYKN